MHINRIAIVQNRESQIDAPLYARIAADPGTEIRVFYTDPQSSSGRPLDTETGKLPVWDNLTPRDYPQTWESSARIIATEISRFRPDHVVICGWFPRQHIALALRCKAAGMSVGVRFDSTLEHTRLSGVSGRVRQNFVANWLRLFDVWHPASALAEKFARKLGGDAHPVVMMPYCVDVDWIDATVRKHVVNRGLERLEFGVNEDDILVVAATKWTEREDPITLVRAFLAARKSCPNLRLILMGDGTLRREVEALSQVAEGTIVLPGYVSYSRLIRIFGIADVFVHPARSEPFGVSVQEALACGLRVIASDRVGSVADFQSQTGQFGVFPAGDVDALVQRLVTTTRPTLGEQAEFRKMARTYNYEQTICKLTNLGGHSPKRKEIKHET